VYGKGCTLGNDVPDCVFNNPLSLSPRDPPSALQCIRSQDGDGQAGTCRTGPNKHGDACNQDGECASNHCIRELRICKGVDEGEICEPTLPDPCQPGHFCNPVDNTAGTGRCAKVVSAGRTCTYSEGCERGFFCAGQDKMSRKCIPPFSVPDYVNTTIGAWMCASANAVQVAPATTFTDAIFTCMPNNGSRVGEICNPAQGAPPGFECVCSSTGGGTFRLRTIEGLGLGARSTVWRELFTCLMKAEGITGELCEFDSEDMTIVRYGSCPYYSCYPQLLRLVNVTGGRFFAAPLDQFMPFAQCEWDAAKAYYTKVLSTECLTLPLLENWRCAVESYTSLTVANTSGVIAVIFLIVGFGYLGHLVYYRKHNRQKVPFFN
jgi:hypothetical protein